MAETYLDRLIPVLTGRVGIRELHFLRFDLRSDTDSFRLTKELNMHKTLVPSGARLNEHHCRRLLTVAIQTQP